ncbi:MAG TPA: trypsin-like peptidase domain-containing protein [Streptosporangiaceae bacterium]|nr:trypsin-like peptidase domain-containing protein [Streptosporangiaceae bacterium]
MKVSQRARRAGIATAMAVVIGGGGFAAGTATTGPEQTARPPAATAQSGDTARSSYADVVRRVLPSVVLIRTTDGLGSGVVLDDAGNIVTNAHVAGTATSFQVQLAGDPQPRHARLAGSYAAGDLAVIRVDDRSGLKPASFGDSDKAQAGDVVLAVGNPLGLSGSVTEGIISATGRAVTEPASASSPGTTLPDVIQISAPVNPGNSGGALVNTSGQMIGIPTLAAASPQNGSQAQGIGFAIPANLARDIAAQLIKTGHVTSTGRAAIGAQVATITGPDGTPAGAGIIAVTPGGPADRAGLRAGDVIQAIGQTRTPDTTALAEALAGARPGQAVTVTIARNAQTLNVQVTLGELSGG